MKITWKPSPYIVTNQVLTSILNNPERSNTQQSLLQHCDSPGQTFLKALQVNEAPGMFLQAWEPVSGLSLVAWCTWLLNKRPCLGHCSVIVVNHTAHSLIPSLIRWCLSCLLLWQAPKSSVATWTMRWCRQVANSRATMTCLSFFGEAGVACKISASR